MSWDSAAGSLDLPATLNLDASLARFSRHGDDLMDRWDGTIFLRPFRIRGRVGAVRLRRLGRARLRLQVDTDSGKASGELTTCLQSMFVDEEAALLDLAARDPVIAELRALHPGVFPVRTLDPLAALLSIVTAQQINLAVALSFRRTILLRLGQRIAIGEDFVMAPDPDRLASASDEDWAAVHFSRSKARCLAALGLAVTSGELSFEELESAGNEEVRARLMELPGLGPWTASQYLTRVLGRPVVVADDLGVRKAIQLGYRLPVIPSAIEVLRITEDYGPAAFTAQQLLLYHLSRASIPRSALGVGGAT